VLSERRAMADSDLQVVVLSMPRHSRREMEFGIELVCRSASRIDDRVRSTRGNSVSARREKQASVCVLRSKMGYEAAGGIGLCKV
jgi:hypothetical protein